MASKAPQFPAERDFPMGNKPPTDKARQSRPTALNIPDSKIVAGPYPTKASTPVPGTGGAPVAPPGRGDKAKPSTLTRNGVSRAGKPVTSGGSPRKTPTTPGARSR